MSNVANIVGNIVTDSGVDIDSKASLGAANDFSPAVSATAGEAYAVKIDPTLTATANNDTLVGLDINPVYLNGAFTGVNNYALRVTGSSLLNGNLMLGSTPISASAILQADSTTKGFLMPRMTTTQRDAIVSPATGLQIYNTTTNKVSVYNGTSWVEGGGDNIYTADGTLTSTTRVLSYSVTGNNENKLIFRNTGVTGGPNDDFIFEASIATAPKLTIWNPNYGGAISFSAGSIGFGGGRMYLSTSGHDITFSPGGVQAVRFFNGTGNVVIQNGGTFVDNGYKLDVQGTFKIGVRPGIGGQQAITFTHSDVYNTIQSASWTFFQSTFGLFLGAGNGQSVYLGVNGSDQLSDVAIGYESWRSKNASAILDIRSSTKGFLPPRMTSTQKSAISTPATGLVIYQTDSTEGLYQYKSTGWEAIGGGGANIYNSNGTLTGDRTISTTSGYTLTINPVTTFNASTSAVSGLGRGVIFTPTILPTANNDTVVGMDIYPSFGTFSYPNNFNSYTSFPIGVRISGNNPTNFNALDLVNYAGNSGETIALNFYDNGAKNRFGGLRYELQDGGNLSSLQTFIHGQKVAQYYSTGNLVIQTGGTFTDAGYKLDVQGTGRVSGDVIFGSGSGSSLYVKTNQGSASGDIPANYASIFSGNYSVVIGASAAIATNSRFIISYPVANFSSPNISALEINGVESGYGSLLLMKSGGNVGIGATPNSSYKLDVNGTARFYGGSTAGAVFGGGATVNLASDAYMFATSTTGKNAGYTANRFSTSEYASFDLITSASFTAGWSIQMRPSQTRLDIVDRYGSENVRMSFFSGGNVAINTTTDAGYKFDVNGSTRIGGLLTTSSGVVGTYANFSGNAAFGTTNQIGIGGNGGFGGGCSYWFEVVSNNLTINATGNTASAVEFNGSGGSTFIYTGLSNALAQRNVTMGFTAGIDGYHSQFKSVLNATGNTFANTLYVRGFFVDSGTITPNSTTVIPIGFENVSGTNLFNSTSGTTLFGGQYSSLNTSAQVQINSTTKGFLQPRMTTTERNAIASPATGLQVYNTTTNTNDYYNGTAWVSAAAGNIYTADGTLAGNRTVTMGSFFLKFDKDIIVSNTIRAGYGAGGQIFNTAFGSSALNSNTTGNFNVAIGSAALQDNTTGAVNTAVGVSALQSNTTGFANVGIGSGPLANMTSGSNNIAIGDNAGKFITGGVTSVTTAGNSIFIGRNTQSFADNNTNQIVIGNDATGLGSNTTIIGNSSTITTAIRGRLLLGTTTDSGSYQLDVNGTARINNNMVVASASTGFSGLTVGGASGQNHITIDSTQNSELRFSTNGSTRSFFRQFENNELRFYTAGGTILSNWNVFNNNFVFSNTSIVGGADASSVMEIRSSNRGFLPPRMTATQLAAIATPAVGLVAYQTDGTEGLYQYKSTGWTLVAGSGGGSGTVTTVSVATANGFAGTVANATTTPAITVSTTVTGLLKGNGTAISAATDGTDYFSPSTLQSGNLNINISPDLGGVSKVYFTGLFSATEILPVDSPYTIITPLNFLEPLAVETKFEIYTCDASTGNIVVNLPTLGIAGYQYQTRMIIIKRTDESSNTVTITAGGSDTVDGGSNAILRKQSSVMIYPVGTNWIII